MVAPILEVKSLNLNFGRQKVLDNVSFKLYQGRILALIGPNGAGKSSIMRIIAGLVTPENGQLMINGSALSTFSEIHQIAGFFIEGPDFYNNLNALQNLMLLKKIRKSEQPVLDLLRMVGIHHAARKRVGKYSTGMKQRLGIAQALLRDPSILVLDEPFNGLDPEVKQFVMNLIKDLSLEKNKSILVSSHLLSDLEALADDFVLLSEGRVHAEGSLSDYANERHEVRFWFEKEPPVDILQKVAAGNMLQRDPWCWETRLTTAETTEAVGRWADDGCIPYEIQRSDLLHSKYLEIVR